METLEYCETCEKYAPNKAYCVYCGTIRPTKQKKTKKKEVEKKLIIRKGEYVYFDFYNTVRYSKIRKVLRKNVTVTVVLNNKKRRIVTIPIKDLRTTKEKS